MVWVAWWLGNVKEVNSSPKCIDCEAVICGVIIIVKGVASMIEVF